MIGKVKFSSKAVERLSGGRRESGGVGGQPVRKRGSGDTEMSR